MKFFLVRLAIPALALALEAAAHAQSGGVRSRPTAIAPSIGAASGGGTTSGGTTSGGTSGSGAPLAKFEPAGNRVYHGASLDQTWDDSGLRKQLQQYEQYAGKKLSVVTWYASVYQDGQTTSWRNQYLMPLRRVKKAGALSLIKFSFQDAAYNKNKRIAPLKQVALGGFDTYFEEAADAVREFGDPVFISLNHEMNGVWYPYSESYPNSGVTAADFVAAWQRVVGVFRKKGVNNVAWVWSPNVPDVGTVPFAKYYPGDDYVDWIGVSFYSGNPMSNLNTLYRTYAPRKPFFITEWATGLDKNQYYEGFPGEAQWVSDFFDSMQRNYPRVKAISWFQWDKRQYGESDYTLQRVPEQAAVYRKDIQNPRFIDNSGALTLPGGNDAVPLQITPSEIVLREVAPVTRAAVAAPPVEKVRVERPRLQIVPREKVAQERG